MNKLSCVVASPLSTFSGYGTMSRAFVKALIKAKGEEWDIKLLSLRWGDTPFGALDSNNEEDKDLINRIIPGMPPGFQPDIWIQISVSNEFMKIGKYNIGYSCLVETNLVPGEMMEGLNNMDLNLVSCEHAKQIAKNSVWDKLDDKRNKIGLIKLEKPVETLFLGLDVTKFKKPEVVKFDLSNIKEEFCFLCVGHLLSGVDILEDRKMIGRLIKSFLETFKNKKNRPALILKCSTGVYSYMDEENSLRIINNIVKSVQGSDLPNIYLIHGELTESELCELYAHDKVKAFTLVGNEGFGLPYIEFSAVSGKPILCSPWSGHIDFLKQEFNVFVSGRIEQVHPNSSNNFLLKEALWFKPDLKDLSYKLEDLYNNYSKYVDNGKRQGYRSRTDFTIDKMSEKLGSILNQYVPKMSVPVSIQLPKLKKLDFTKPVEDIQEIK